MFVWGLKIKNYPSPAPAAPQDSVEWQMLPGFLLSPCSSLSLCWRKGLRLQGLIFTLSPYSSLTVLWCAETRENKTTRNCYTCLIRVVLCLPQPPDWNAFHFLFLRGKGEEWERNLLRSGRMKGFDLSEIKYGFVLLRESCCHTLKTEASCPVRYTGNTLILKH